MKEKSRTEIKSLLGQALLYRAANHIHTMYSGKWRDSGHAICFVFFRGIRSCLYVPTARHTAFTGQLCTYSTARMPRHHLQDPFPERHLSQGLTVRWLKGMFAP